MPPTFTKSLKRVDGNIGHDVSMDCKVSGSQPMTIAWFKDEQEIKSGNRFQPEFKDNSATLRISRLEKADSGVYKCRATNSAGFKETSGTLYVKGYHHVCLVLSVCCVDSYMTFCCHEMNICFVDGLQSPQCSQQHRITRMSYQEPQFPSGQPSLEQLL